MEQIKQKCSGEHFGTKVLCGQRFECAKYFKHYPHTVFALKDKCESFVPKVKP